MNKNRIAASLIALMSMHAQADTLMGLYLGGQVWSNTTSGSFGNTSSADNQVILDFDNEYQGSFNVAFEHPIPLIPNIKIASTTLDTIGSTTLSTSFTFEGETYNNSAYLATTVNASYLDYTLYYELFDNDLLTLDFGITARDLDAYVKIVESSNNKESDLAVSGYIPMLYLSTIVGLPFTGYNIFAEGNIMSIDSQTIYDVQAGVSYELIDNLLVDVDITLGYRSVKIALNDLDNLSSDLSFSGAFTGVIVHF